MNFKVGKYTLDREQSKIVTCDKPHLLVVAGAGSGKTLTILGKIKYLVEEKNISPEEIICISFTKAASEDLKRKIANDLSLEMDVYTFHKLALEILKKRSSFDIAEADLLETMTEIFFREGILEDEDTLKLVMAYFSLKKKSQYIKFYNQNLKDVKTLERLITTFLRLFKANAHEIEDFLAFLEEAKKTFNFKKYKQEKIILSLALNIYMQYQHYLEENDEIDFDDMLTKAKISVENFGFFHKIKYVIIDEYQDTSLVRFNLVKTILDKTGASLVAVGDDFQSIYRFTGCDLSLFLDFKKIFPKGEILKIQNTYRNSQELIEVAGDFVMKNREQMRKKLRSQKRLDRPIVFVTYKNGKDSLLNLIKNIHNQNDGEILILGRNNRDIDLYLDLKHFKKEEDNIVYIKDPSIKIKYLTAHRSKGLEAENVIILNMRDDQLGFPNQIKDDKILRFVSPHRGAIPFDEERRLFYVALTRTKNKVFLLVPNIKPSLFALELQKNYRRKIETIKKSS